MSVDQTRLHSAQQRLEAWDGMIRLIERVKLAEAQCDAEEIKRSLDDLEAQYRLVTYNLRLSKT